MGHVGGFVHRLQHQVCVEIVGYRRARIAQVDVAVVAHYILTLHSVDGLAILASLFEIG